MTKPHVHHIKISEADKAEDLRLAGLSDDVLMDELVHQLLTTVAGVTEFMRTVSSPQEWDERKRMVRAANPTGFDRMWLDAVVGTGLTVSVRANWDKKA